MFVHSPIVSSIRFVRFRNAPVIPRQETANTGPSPFLVTTTSTVLVLSPPRIIFSEPLAAAGEYSRTIPSLILLAIKGGCGNTSCGRNPPSSTRRQQTYQWIGLI